MTDHIERAAGSVVTEPFVVMAKPVGPACNLNCSYCYYLETAGLYADHKQFKMSDKTLETFIRQYIDASPGPEVLFVWHGGEPTLAGLDFFRRAIELQNKYLPEGWICRNNLQTNGILLDDEWCSFLAEYGFDVGLSIDGTQWVHDAYRKDHGGHGTYQKAAEAVNRLKEHDIQPDLLCTVTSTTVREPLSVYRALRDFDTGWIQFIPIVRRTPEGEVTPDSVTAEQYGSFLKAVFYDWLYHDLDKLNVQIFAEMSLVWMGGTPSVCWMSPTCGKALIVEHDGTVYSCDHFVNREHVIGDITASNIGALITSPAQRNFGNGKKDTLPGQCLSCAWLDVCNGGCLKDRFISTGDGEPGLNYLCEGYRLFYRHAEKPLKQVIARRRRGESPIKIMAALREEAKTLWKGIGRNDPCPCGSGLKAKNCCWEHRP